MNRAGRAMTHRLNAEKVMVKIIEFEGFLYNEGNVPDPGHGNPPVMIDAILFFCL
jgi:hypothetical protein